MKPGHTTKCRKSSRVSEQSKHPVYSHQRNSSHQPVDRTVNNYLLGQYLSHPC